MNGDELLVLVQERGATAAPGHTGLYHFALLVPERAGLARWLAHAARDRVSLTGASDHFVSEALYLNDPRTEPFDGLPSEVDRVLERLQHAGHAVEPSESGPMVRDPSGNAMVLVSGDLT